MKLRELFEAGVSYLREHQVHDSENDAWLLMEYVSGIRRIDYLRTSFTCVEAAKADKYMSLIERRGRHYPLQYITGHQEFMGLDFMVNEAVLIPRQDTESLVEAVLEHMKTGDEVLDMCTGSGCIIISLAAKKQVCRAVGADISEEAMKVARANAKHNHVKDIEFVQSDLFDKIEGCYDIIVANPPYIPSEDVEELMPEVKLYEPVLALDGASDGLSFYRRIIQGAKAYLKSGGYLFFEIGCNQAKEICEMLRENGFLEAAVRKDLAGLDRVVYATYNAKAIAAVDIEN